jgi:hypothetical protein
MHLRSTVLRRRYNNSAFRHVQDGQSDVYWFIQRHFSANPIDQHRLAVSDHELL